MSMSHASTHQLGIIDLIRVGEKKKKRAGAFANVFFFSSARQINNDITQYQALWQACLMLTSTWVVYAQATTIVGYC